MGSAAGAEKVAARRTGQTLEQYREQVSAGNLWCTGCKAWHAKARFSVDRSRGSGRGATCLIAKRGPRGKRDPQKEKARYAVNLAVRYGRLPKPNALPCVDCGHEWKEGERRQEYDHHEGYALEHHLTVEPVCTLCHADREKERRDGR